MISQNINKQNNFAVSLRQKKQNKANLKNEYITGLTIFATGFAFLAILLVIIIIGLK